MKRIAVLALAASFPVALAAQDSGSSCAAHHSPSAVDERGDHVMGFDHTKTTHHFRLTADGGVIEVTANDADDTESVTAIRSHLGHIAKMFAGGDFEAPMRIHDRVPPGVPVLKRDRTRISWTYGDLPAGGQVVASTKDEEDVAALHEFLRFQIEDHRTGDSTVIAPTP
jgi:hypothetical protein